MKVILGFVKPNERSQICVASQEYINALSTLVIISYGSNSTLLPGVQQTMKFSIMHKAILKGYLNWPQEDLGFSDVYQGIAINTISGQVLNEWKSSMLSSSIFWRVTMIDRIPNVKSKILGLGSSLSAYQLHCDGEVTGHLWITA